MSIRARHAWRAEGCGKNGKPGDEDKAVTKKNPGEDLKCPYCDKIYKQDGALKIHIQRQVMRLRFKSVTPTARMHAGLTPCTLSPRAFFTALQHAAEGAVEPDQLPLAKPAEVITKCLRR